MSLFLLLIPFSRSWWGHAHAVIGNMAERALTKAQNNYLKELMAVGVKDHETVTEVASWMDDLKDRYAFRVMDQWHFADGQIVEEGYDKPLPNPIFNITSYLDDGYKAIMNETTTDPWILGFHLRAIIHFIGDVHMPNHNAEKFLSGARGGDGGGNLYYITCDKGSACRNLHFYWDSAAATLNEFYPLAPKYRSTFNQQVTNMIETHKESMYPDTTTTDFHEWSHEAFEIARDFGYSIPQNTWPTPEYTQMAIDKSYYQIALAGYRLTHVLKDFLNRKNLPQINVTGVSYSEIAAWCVDVLLLTGVIIFTVLLHRRSANLYSSQMI